MSEIDGAAQVSEKTSEIKKVGGFASKIRLSIIMLIVGLVVGAGLAMFLTHYNPKDEKSESEILAASIVFDRIVAQNELVTASQKYSIVEKVGNVGKIPFTDIPIPFTANSYWYRYVGTVKVGVDLSKAEFDQQGNTISITLEQPGISSNTPDREKSGVMEENNNILNPIHLDEVDQFLAQCQEKGEEQVREGGIMEEAKANAEQNVRSMFIAALGEDCKVEFTWKDSNQS